MAARRLQTDFCELNDPDDQAERFKDQVKAKDAGDKEAMAYDEDYVIALEHGMPPAVGVGIGIDRLAMLKYGINDLRCFYQASSSLFTI